MTPNQADTRKQLNDIAHEIERRLPTKMGFILMVFPFGQPSPEDRPPDERAMLNYVSNCKRQEAINVLKEWLIKCSAAEDWMKHLK